MDWTGEILCIDVIHESVVYVFIFPSCEATSGMNTISTQKWADKKSVNTVHISFYVFHDKHVKFINDIFHISTPCLSSSANV